jgi:diguanylate cyclase (GGDEF)-like protein
MLVDGLDQLHLHGEIYTAVWEKTTLLIGFFLVFFGMRTWIADHVEMNKKLETQAYRDELTGLFNRRGMLQKFDAMDEVAKSEHLNMSFIIADLDDFKVFNDTMGHVAGDVYLAKLGRCLLALADKNAVIGRWGGEEFAVCMLDSDINQALELSEKIRNVVSEIPLPKEMNGQFMTVSLGVSQKIPQEKYLDAIKRADRSLYLAKNQGKNKSVAG